MPTPPTPPAPCLCRHAQVSHHLTPSGVRAACTVSVGSALAVCGCRRYRTTKPVMLLDVDGVVNAVQPFSARRSWPPTRTWPESDWVQKRVRAGDHRYPITVAQPVLDLLHTIHDLRWAEIRWHTSWQDHAVHDLAPVLGLPRFPVQDRGEVQVSYPLTPVPPRHWPDQDQQDWWKLPAAALIADAGRPLLWLDDDLTSHEELVADSPVGQHPDRLLIAPREGEGLTPHHLAQIAEFLTLTSPIRPA